jgi:hypothetical protein
MVDAPLNAALAFAVVVAIWHLPRVEAAISAGVLFVHATATVLGNSEMKGRRTGTG